jgi:hypothetical protein
MHILEKNLENIILTTPNKVLNQKGLPIYGKKKFQVNLGSYGRADLITLERELDMDDYPILFVTIYELKQRVIDINTFAQVAKYEAGILRYFQKTQRFKNFEIKINKVLIGHSVKESMSLCSMNNLYVDANIYTYDFTIDGLFFKYFDTGEIRYINEGF